MAKNENLYWICAQPASFYYSWQVDAMLLSFEKSGEVDLSKVHIVSSVPSFAAGPNDRFKKVQDKWVQKGVLFSYYEDTRGAHNYISSIRPHILQKHWQAYPWLAAQNIMYHDCDIALTKPLPLEDKLSKDLDKTCFVSDTISYVGAKYIESKKHGIFEKMCEIVDIDQELVRNKEKESGGAQYLLKPGITAQFWQKVYRNSEDLYKIITERVREVKKEEPDWHEIQIWCADMWAVLWNLWKLGYDTPCHDDFEFGWGTQQMSQWEKHAIFHNAGVTKQETGKPFYKGLYINTDPTKAPRPDDNWASQKYYDLIKESWDETSGNGTSTTHIAVVATNVYFLLGLQFIRQFWDNSIEKNIKFHFFSDIDPTPYLKEGMQCQYWPENHRSWQDATNSKFKNMLKIELGPEDSLFYFDADTSISSKFTTGWFLKGDLVGGEHYANRSFLSGNKGYDRNHKSKAYIPEDSELEAIYYYGAFFGGKKQRVTEFLQTLVEWQTYDTEVLGYEPVVNDESYINKYFHYTPPQIVKCEDFKFNISDKGGIEGFRTVNCVDDTILQQLAELKDKNWHISGGTVREIR